MIIKDVYFNQARHIAFQSLCLCLDECYNKKGISEKRFSELWMNETAKHEDIITNGWYSPPPMGIAVLSGGETYPIRINYDSLRNPKYWPNNNVIDWNNDLFYVYYSPLSVSNNMPGDISVTIYFGKNSKIRDHFKRTHEATLEIINNIELCDSSKELFIHYESVLKKHKLLGCGLSNTDIALTNIGHTLPVIELNNCKDISNEKRREISQARAFINGITSWTFDNTQFTIEPQLMSAIDPELPQISYHYLMCKRDDGFHFCNDVDFLLKRFDLV